MTKTAKIKEVEHSAVWSWRSRAARDHVSLKDSRRTRWFKAGDLGCAGLYTMGSGRARLKGIWVDPAFRHQGIGTRLTEHLMALARAEDFNHIEAYAWDGKWYLARGFTSIGRNAHGAERFVLKYLENNRPIGPSDLDKSIRGV